MNVFTNQMNILANPINSVKFQYTRLTYRNLLLFYTLIMSYKKEKARINPIYNCIKKNKIPRNKLNQGGE